MSPSKIIRHDYRYFDVIRLLAAQMVLVGHGLNLFFPSVFMHLQPDGSLVGRTDHFVVQNFGVGIFFAISGYLVTASAMRTHLRTNAGFRPFLIGRFRRIYGPLASLLLLLFAIESLIYPPRARLGTIVVDVDLRTLMGNLLLLVDHPLMAVASRLTGWAALHTSALGTAAQLWTVFAEWWIYVLFGATYFVVAERRLTVARIIWALIAMPVPLYWLSKGNALPLAWLVGMTFALYDRRIRTVPIVAIIGAFLACVALSTARVALATWSLYDPLFLVPASAAILLGFHALPHAPNLPRPAERLIRYFSDRSYSLYLVHLSVLTAITTFAPGATAIVGIVGGIIAANAVADLFYRLFERRWLTTNR